MRNWYGESAHDNEHRLSYTLVRFLLFLCASAGSFATPASLAAEDNRTHPSAEEAKAHQTFPFDQLKLSFNGHPIANAEAPISFLPGEMNRLSIAPLPGTANAWQVRVRKRLPTGEVEEQSALVGSSGGKTFALGPMTAPPVFESESGEVYRRGYGIELLLRETAKQSVYGLSYTQGPASGPMVYWRRGIEIGAGTEHLRPGQHQRFVYNPGFGVEASLTLRLSERVLRDSDDVEVQVRLNPGALVERLTGQLRVMDASGAVLVQKEVRIPAVGQWTSDAVDVEAWPDGDYRIAFFPNVEGRVWEEGPSVQYRRRTQTQDQLPISPFAPWTLERDPGRPEIRVSDFREVVDSWTSGLGEWVLQTNNGRAALSAPVGRKVEPLVLRPHLRGSYAVFARPYADGCLLQVSGDKAIRSVARVESVFLTATDMTGGNITVFPFDAYSEPFAGLAELHLVPVTTESVTQFYGETSHPPVPLYGVNDWAEYFWGHARLESDQFTAIVAGQAELGLRTIDWSVGRSWVEYESELPNTHSFPTVPLEEAAMSFQRAPLYHGRAVMINEKRPLHHVLSSRERLGIEVWPWLAMNRHYGDQYGGMFSSRWFKQNPQWHRWHKNASAPDAGEVSYFFPQVRQERVDIFLEVAARGVDGVVVGACRQVPMLLYHPEMVAAYKKETGVDPQQIDASDGQVYRDWIRWRADHFTQVLRMLKEGLTKIGRQQGRDVPVAVRVPTVGLFYNLAQGLDVEQWCREGLVDQLQLVPLETCGGRGTHDVQQYLDLGRQYGVTMIGGIGANWMSDQGIVPALYRALDLIDTGVAGIEFYESEMLARTSPIRWVMPVFGNRPRLESMLCNSNVEACFPITANNAMFGFDNHAKWAEWGDSVHDDSPNAL